MEGQGETILKRKKGKRTGTPGKRLERERRETIWRDRGKQLMPLAGKRPGCRGKQSERRIREPDLRVGGPNPPRAQGSQPTQEGRRNCAHFILDSTKFGTLYLYRTEVFIDGPCKEINPLLNGLQEVKC